MAGRPVCQLSGEATQGEQLIAGILLAAGRSLRFGRQKLLEAWDGEPLVRRAARTFLDGGLAPVLIVVAEDPELRAALQGLSVQLVVNRHPEIGISHSIQLGVEALPARARAVVIGVSDQPLVNETLIRRMRRSFRPGVIIVPRYGTVTGNPRLYDQRFFSELLKLSGDTGGQVIARRHPEAVIEIEQPAALGVDVDTQKDWARIRKA